MNRARVVIGVVMPILIALTMLATFLAVRATKIQMTKDVKCSAVSIVLPPPGRRPSTSPGLPVPPRRPGPVLPW